MAIDEGTVSLRELTPAEYERGPTRIMAARWGGKFGDDNAAALGRFTGGYFRVFYNGTEPALAEVYDELHDTWVKVKPFDWIIRGVKGEFYPCDRHVFAETYTATVAAADLLALDRLRRDQLTGMPAKLSAVLDDWMDRNFGTLSSGHHVGDFLETLQAEGLGVFPVADRTG